MIVFEVLTGDNWNDKFFRYYRTVNGALATIFFITLMIVVNYVLLMLFIAILVENFDEDSIN